MKIAASHVNNIPKIRMKYDVLLDPRGWKCFEFFARPRLVVSKYLEIVRLGEGESNGLLNTIWEMSLTYSSEVICDRYHRREREG